MDALQSTGFKFIYENDMTVIVWLESREKYGLVRNNILDKSGV